MTTFVSEKCAGKNRKKNKPYLKSVTSKLVENTKAVIKKKELTIIKELGKLTTVT